jgi:hypothetical protein
MDGRNFGFACIVGAMLMAGPVQADMVSGIAICSPNDSGIRWTGSSPTDVVEPDATCGAIGVLVRCPRTPKQVLRAIKAQEGCVAVRGTDVSTTRVAFVCTGAQDEVVRAVEELCEAMVP